MIKLRGGIVFSVIFLIALVLNGYILSDFFNYVKILYGLDAVLAAEMTAVYMIAFLFLFCWMLFIVLYAFLPVLLILPRERSKQDECVKCRTKCPFVTVQIPCYNEPFHVVKEAIDSCIALEYPKEKLEIQVLDDSTPVFEEELNEESLRGLRKYCKEKGLSYIRREGHKGFKAGNLNVGLKYAKGELLLVLDADSYVPPDILKKIVPAFCKDPSLGYVQGLTRTSNYSESVVARLMDLAGRGYWEGYLPVHSSYGFIAFNGHNGVIRRSALDEIGGWNEQSITEDLDMSVRMRLAGYGGQYAEYVTCLEKKPTRFDGARTQIRRWSHGAVMVLKNYFGKIVSSNTLKWHEKLDMILYMLFFPFHAIAIVFLYATLFLSAAFPGFYDLFPQYSSTICVLGSFASVFPMFMLSLLGIAALDISFAKAFFKNIVYLVLLFSGLIPTITLGVLSAVFGRKEKFHRTPKIKKERNRFLKRVQRGYFRFTSAGIYLILIGILSYYVSPQIMLFNIIGIVVTAGFITAPFLFN